MRDDRVEQVLAVIGAFRREAAPGPAISLDHTILVGHAERRQARQRNRVEALRPLAFAQIEPVRRQRPIDRLLIGVERFLARAVVVIDLGKPFPRSILDQRLEHDGYVRQIVEQRVELLCEQRQPVLHPGMAAAFAHRLKQWVALCAPAKFGSVAHAKSAPRFVVELDFARWDKIERDQLRRGALALRIEAADRLKLLAEEIETDRRVASRSKEVDDAAAHSVLADIPNGGRSGKAVGSEPAHDFAHGPDLTRRQRKRLRRDLFPRRCPLQRRVDRGEDNRARRGATAGQSSQCRHATC